MTRPDWFILPTRKVLDRAIWFTVCGAGAQAGYPLLAAVLFLLGILAFSRADERDRK